MDKKAKLAFELVDVFGDFVNENAEIMLECQELTDRQRARADASGRFVVPGLIGPPRNRYKVQIEVPGYRFVSFFASAQEKETPDGRVVFLAVEPAKVIRVQFPEFVDLAPEARALLEHSDQVQGFPSMAGKGLYDAFDDIRRSGFLNIVAKCSRTRLSNARTVLSYFTDPVSRLTDVRGDRFFAQVPQELRDETKNSVAAGLFDPASSALHRPPDGFTSAGSFKTPDRAGNLQLTFHAQGGNFASDIDIDDLNGFAHIFQLIQNIGGRTHPYNIHQILVRSQEIDPGYRLFVR
jgi:hypothetical protein